MSFLITTILISVVRSVEVLQDLQQLLSLLSSSPTPSLVMLCQQRPRVNCSEFQAVFSQIPAQYTIPDRLVFFSPPAADFSYLSYFQVKHMPQSLLVLRGNLYYLDVDRYSNRLLMNFAEYCKQHPAHPHRPLRSEPFTALDSFKDIFLAVDDSIYFFCSASRGCISFVYALLAVLLAILAAAMCLIVRQLKSAREAGDRDKKTA